MALFCPNVISYRRLTRYQTAPINTHWGYDNRTAGLPVPNAGAADRRVENRCGGADPTHISPWPPRWPAATWG